MNKEMREVFIVPPSRAHPLLPFAEYVVKSSEHPLCKMDNRRNYEDMFMATYLFPNGHEVSVISGELFYCKDGAPYEVMWTTDPDESDVFPYQTDEQLMLLLAKISQQPERK